MKGNRKQYKLEEVAEVFTGFPFKGDKYHNSEGTKVVRGENVTIGNLRWDTVKYWNEEFDEFEKYALDEGDIVIGMDGSRVGKNRAQIKANDLPLLLAQRVARIRAKKNFDQDFLAHIIKSDEFENYVKAVHTGTSIPHISGTQLKEFEFKATPDLKEQKQIASILSSLDNKIELNLQMNQTLEEMAQAIFREWFVNFNFPCIDGKLVNGLPRGWRMGRVSDICVVNKNTLSIKDEIETIEYIEISEVSKGIINEISTYSRGEEPSRARRKLRHGDTVVSTVRPDRGSYFLAITPKDNLIASTGFAVFSPTSVPFSFLYCLLTSSEQMEFYGKMADGATYPAINPSIIMNIELAIPSDEVLQLFHLVVGNLYLKINQNFEENRTLNQLRDGLLPKLMTGQIEVKA